MSDNTDFVDESAEDDAKHEPTTFVVTTTRQFEIDLTEREQAGLVQQQRGQQGDIMDAIEVMMVESEKEQVKPEEKRLALETTVEEA